MELSEHNTSENYYLHFLRHIGIPPPVGEVSLLQATVQDRRKVKTQITYFQSGASCSRMYHQHKATACSLHKYSNCKLKYTLSSYPNQKAAAFSQIINMLLILIMTLCCPNGRHLFNLLWQTDSSFTHQEKKVNLERIKKGVRSSVKLCCTESLRLAKKVTLQ